MNQRIALIRSVLREVLDPLVIYHRRPRVRASMCLARRRCDVILAMLRHKQPYLTPDQRAALTESTPGVPEAA